MNSGCQSRMRLYLARTDRYVQCVQQLRRGGGTIITGLILQGNLSQRWREIREFPLYNEFNHLGDEIDQDMLAS
jgi:hypothetical protein